MRASLVSEGALNRWGHKAFRSRASRAEKGGFVPSRDIPSTQIREQKRALRKRVRATVLALDAATREDHDRRLQAIAQDLPGFSSAQTLLLYVKAFAEEIETRQLLETVVACGRRLVLPRVDPVMGLLLFEVTDLSEQLAPGALGIPEPRPMLRRVDPSEVDWALVPGLAFDLRCRRLGRGAGYYDRLLPALRPDAPRWAVAFECQVIDHIPTEPHDQALTGVATPFRRLFRS